MTEIFIKDTDIKKICGIHSFFMENEIKDPSCNEAILTPKMFNSYFWLIDHYTLTHTSTVKINEILLKIKILDSSIYELYIK